MKNYTQPEALIIFVEDIDLLTASVSLDNPKVGEDDMTSPF